MDNRQIVLEQIPQGKLTPDHFRMQTTPAPAAADGEVLVRTRYISLDAANRAWMQGATYRSALQAGDVMAGGSVAEVVESKAAGLKAGDLVFADTGWQEYAAVPAKGLAPLPDLKPMTHLISVYGVAGLTAYFGLMECGRPQAGETVVVSAAAGSVGSIVGQLAKIKGCRVIGIAGGPEKCRWLTHDLGFDGAIDYKSEDVGEALSRLAPNGVDINFENVGGEVMDAVIGHMNNFSRMPLCGMISTYNREGAIPGPSDFGRVLMHRILIKGFIVIDYLPRAAEAMAELEPLVAGGQLKWKVHIVDGLENAVGALGRLFTGDHDGKLLVQVSPEPKRA